MSYWVRSLGQTLGHSLKFCILISYFRSFILVLSVSRNYSACSSIEYISLRLMFKACSGLALFRERLLGFFVRRELWLQFSSFSLSQVGRLSYLSYISLRAEIRFSQKFFSSIRSSLCPLFISSILQLMQLPQKGICSLDSLREKQCWLWMELITEGARILMVQSRSILSERWVREWVRLSSYNQMESLLFSSWRSFIFLVLAISFCYKFQRSLLISFISSCMAQIKYSFSSNSLKCLDLSSLNYLKSCSFSSSNSCCNFWLRQSSVSQYSNFSSMLK